MLNPWKLATIGLSAVITTALVTGLVVAGWNARSAEREPTGTASRAAAPGTPGSGVPTQAAVVDCNQLAAAQAGSHDRTGEVVKDTAVGALIGAAVGAAGGAAAGGGKGAGKGAAIGGIVGAGGGSLYGLNENKRHDEAYRAAYARCMAARGYPG